MGSSAQAIASLIHSLDEESWGRSYAPGKWTFSQILCHLADCELAFGFRMRQALAEENHLVQTFDQEAWAKPYPSLDGRVGFEVFQSVRNWNLALVRSQPATYESRNLRHPERGEMTFGGLLQLIAGHDLNHLSQLETIAASTS